MILVAGSANLDFVVRAPRIPQPGETVLGREFETFAGGKGANQAIASARAGGAPTAMLLALGNDRYAEPLEASLRAAGVRLHIVRSEDRPTGMAFICVSDDAQNAITVAPGANTTLRDFHLPPLDGFTHLLMQLETPIPTVSAYAAAARARKVTVVLNAAPAQKLPASLLANVDMLIVNEHELGLVAGHKGSMAHLLDRVGVPSAVVTLGERGCHARVDGKVVSHPGFKVKAVDTTAAGDTFCGVLVAALGRRVPFAEAMREANAAAALACTRLGAQSSIPTYAEVDAFLHKQTANSA